MGALIHVANVLYLASYSVRDILALRALTVIAILMIAPYYFSAGPLWEAIAWNTVFLAINLVQLWRLVLERRPVTLAPEVRALHALAFSTLTPRQFQQLISIGRWDAPAAGRLLVEAEAPLERLSVVADGKARVEKGERTVAELEGGRFIGERSYLTGEAPSVRVVADAGLRVVHWPTKALRDFLATRPEVRTVMQNILGADLAHKLRLRTATG
jgi:hypothetical protein